MPKYKELLNQKEGLNKELEKIDDGLKKLYTESQRVYSDKKVASKQWFRLTPPQNALNVWRKLAPGSNNFKFSHSEINKFTGMDFEPLDNLVGREGGVNRWWWSMFDQRKFYDVWGQRQYFGINFSALPLREYNTYWWSANFADNYIHNITNPFSPPYVGEYVGNRAYTQYEGSYHILKSGNVNLLALQNAFKQNPDILFVLQNPTQAKIYAATEDALLAKRSPIQEKIKALDPQISQAMEEERVRLNTIKQREELKQKRDDAVSQTFDKRVELLEKAVDELGKQKLDFDQFTVSNMSEIENLRRDIQEIDAQSVLSKKHSEDMQKKTNKDVDNLKKTLLNITGVPESSKNDFTFIQYKARKINKDFLGFSVYMQEQQEKEKETEAALKILSENSLKDLNKTIVLEKMVKELQEKVGDDNGTSSNLIKEIGIINAAIKDKAKLGDERYTKLYADMKDVIEKFNDVNSKTESIHKSMEEQGKQFGTQIDFLSKRFTDLGAQLQKSNELSEQNYDDLYEQYDALDGVMETLRKKIENNTALTGANREEIENKFRVVEGQYKSLQDIFKSTLDKTLFLEKNVKDFNEKVTALAQKQKESDGKSADAVAAVQTEFKQLSEQFDILKKAVDKRKEEGRGLSKNLEASILKSQKSYDLVKKEIETLGNATNAIAGEVNKNTEAIQDVKNRQFLLTDKLNSFIVDTEKKAEEAIAGQNYLKDKHDALNKTVAQHVTAFDEIRAELAEMALESKKDILGVRQQQQQQGEQIGRLEGAVGTNAKKVDALSRTFIEYGDKNKERFLKQASKIGQLENALALLQNKERENAGAIAKHAKEQDAKNISINNAIVGLEVDLHNAVVGEQASRMQIANLAENLDAVKKRTKVLYDVHSTRASGRSVGSGDTRAKAAKPYDIAKTILNNYLGIVFRTYAAFPTNFKPA